MKIAVIDKKGGVGKIPFAFSIAKGFRFFAIK
jgi:MinD superfamily P-loop ATPase